MDNLELQNICEEDINELSNDELLEAYKLIKQYIEALEEDIIRVNEDDK